MATSKHFSSGISLYAVADGHNGRTAARAVHALLPAELDRQLGPGPASGDAVVRALARTFLALDEVICRQFASSGEPAAAPGAQCSCTAASPAQGRRTGAPPTLHCSPPPPGPAGCTLTVAVVSGDTLTLAHVGDSHAMLDTGAEVVRLTSEHRIGLSPAEQARLEASGGRLCRLNEWGSGPSVGMHDGLGPIRLWPGGIMVGRAIGDRDVGEILLPHPHIRQVC